MDSLVVVSILLVIIGASIWEFRKQRDTSIVKCKQLDI